MTMTSNNNTLTLNTLYVNAYGFNDEIADNFPASELFDARSDFDYGTDLKAVAVLMSFVNERFFKGRDASGVRRRVSVSLINDDEHNLVSDANVLINIPRSIMTKEIRVDLPLAYSDIVTSCRYRIVVRDESSKKILGEKRIYFYDRLHLGKRPDKWYKPLKGGLMPDEDETLYKQYCLYPGTFGRVSFILSDNMETPMLLMPEVEVRFTFGDSSQQSHFVTPERLEYDLNEFRVTAPFVVNELNRGLTYAELICMDYPIAGFTFTTCGEAIEGAAEGEFLESIEEYDNEKGLGRFLKSLKTSESGATTESMTPEDSEFDKLLDDFIAGEMQKTEETPEEDFDTVDFGENPKDADSAGEDESAEDSKPSDNQDSSENFQLCLSRLTGLHGVKEKLSVYEKLVRFNKLRAENGLAVTSLPLHAMFMGAPGTGKTTVAKMMGVMLRRAGVLSRGHVVMKERATLMGPNYSNEESNTLQAIEEAQGGILFIDEAYQLYQPNDPRDPGKFVIETLLDALADETKRDWMLILAGYPDEMRRMFEMNPGLKSRIPDSNIYIFDDFSEGELMEIAEKYLDRNNFTLTDGARTALSDRLAADYKNRDRTFGNARHVMNLIQTEILPAMAVRVMSSSEETIPSISEIHASDIPAAISKATKNRQRLGFTA